MTGRREVHIEEANRKVAQDKRDRRDAFAMAALSNCAGRDPVALAEQAYAIADAMLKHTKIRKHRKKARRGVAKRAPFYRDGEVQQGTLL